MEDKEFKKHPSWGVLNFNRETSSGRRILFGSSIAHDHYITLTISRAVLKRDLKQDTIFGDKELIEVGMSATQFAEAITSFSKGEGTPVTIFKLQGERMPENEFESKIQLIDKEFHEDMKELAAESDALATTVKNLLSTSTISKKTKAEIMDVIETLRLQITSNVPFIKDQYTRQVDKTLLEAKNEFEAFVEDKIRTLGLEDFKKELTKIATASQAALEEKT